MTVTALEILGRDRENRPTFLLDRHTRDALQTYVRRRWPTDRRKNIEREFGLTSDQARAVMEGTPSASTIDQIWKSPNGGWAIALPVLSAVIGHGVGEFFALEAQRLRDEATQQQQAAADLADAERVALAVVRRLADPRVAVGPAAVDDRTAAVQRRQSASKVRG